MIDWTNMLFAADSQTLLSVQSTQSGGAVPSGDMVTPLVPLISSFDAGEDILEGVENANVDDEGDSASSLLAAAVLRSTPARCRRTRIRTRTTRPRPHASRAKFRSVAKDLHLGHLFSR